MRLFIVLGLIGLSFLLNSTACAFSCTAAFQNAAGKSSKSIVNYINNCKIAPRGDFASNRAYSDHLQALHYFVKASHKALTKDNHTTISSLEVVESFMKHINRINMCNKGYNDYCSPIYLKLKKVNETLANQVNTYSHKKMKRLCAYWEPKNKKDQQALNYACKKEKKEKKETKAKACKLNGYKIVKNHNGMIDITFHYKKEGRCTKQDIKRLANKLPERGRKERLEYLENKMERACEKDFGSSCDYWSRKIHKKIDNWDFE